MRRALKETERGRAFFGEDRSAAAREEEEEEEDERDDKRMDAIIANANDNNIEIEDFEKTAHGVDVDQIPPPTTIRRNWETMKEKWSTREANGSSRGFRDVFTLLMGLSMTQGLDLGTTLIFTGAYNVVTGSVWDSHHRCSDRALRW